MIFLRNYYVNSTAKTDILLITHDVKRAIRESEIQDGVLSVLIPGGTAGVAILENDPKIYEEYKNWVEAQIPAQGGPRPSRKSGSGRNDAHLRAALVGVSAVLPVMTGKLMLGAWQEVVLFDFDDKVGRREITIQIVGEASK
jgi:secondary thiamine-phosphate synthase enzyme